MVTHPTLDKFSIKSRCITGAIGTAVVNPITNAVGPGWTMVRVFLSRQGSCYMLPSESITNIYSMRYSGHLCSSADRFLAFHGPRVQNGR